MPERRLYHLALAADWAEAERVGSYTTSTIGRTLGDVGYIHMSRDDQVAGTASAFYAGRDDVLLLEIDPALVGSPVVDDEVGGTTFPHLYGPLPVAAVVTAVPYPT